MFVVGKVGPVLGGTFAERFGGVDEPEVLGVGGPFEMVGVAVEVNGVIDGRLLFPDLCDDRLSLALDRCRYG